ncbi:uncharacterized protein [Palaemon carinicauda]|uniref:uncharacterized protein n=1 Tax=Palaemon carinicauda TaxID=392227 RepID=UPI0035B5F692
MPRSFAHIDWGNVGINIDGEYVNNLRVADGIVVLSKLWEESQKMIENLNRKTRNVGLKINMSNTKVIFDENAERQQIRGYLTTNTHPRIFLRVTLSLPTHLLMHGTLLLQVWHLGLQVFLGKSLYRGASVSFHIA